VAPAPGREGARGVGPFPIRFLSVGSVQSFFGSRGPSGARSFSGAAMKMIEALVAPERLGDIKEALSRVEVFRLTVSEATGLERPGGPASAGGASKAAGAAGAPFEARPRVRLEIAVNEAFVAPTVEAIRSACGGTGAGGGRIWIHPLRDAIRVRTGERGPEAI
jgi:nitrogen regulatory protein P-II 2